MHLIHRLLSCVFILFSCSVYSQQTIDNKPIYQRISIGNPTLEVRKVLDEIGVDMTCGAILRNDSLLLEVESSTLPRLEEHGVSYTILIEDITAYYQERSASDLPKARKALEKMKEVSRKKKENVLKNIGQYDDCDEIEWTVPTNFQLNPNVSPNSFGGCLTNSQVMQELDAMRTLYPNLISQRLDASPTNQTTVEGRTIFFVRISDNPDIDEPSEPETLYQSLIHSREAGSVMQLLFYMWYLLENYDTDQNIRNLVNNQALYFIPVYNPDGFVHNQIQNPDGGGMQRKNRNVAGSCSVYLGGIDLNRNSAYYWGNGGSSTNVCSNIYMGPGPFSENETQIMRDFFLQHDFRLALNHHTYKNAMLHGYAGTNITNPRPDEYAKYSHDMSYYNRYAYGPSTSISSLNSGNMNDWMLGGPAGVSSNGTPTGTGSGKNTLAWTPENGSFDEGGFWPLPSNFVPIAKRAMRMNFLAAYYSGKYARLHDFTPVEITGTSGNFTFEVENLGQTASDFTVTVTPISSNISSVGAPVTLTGMNVLEQNNVTISYTLTAGIQPIDTIEFNVTLTNDYLTDNVLFEKTYQKIVQPNVIFEDDPDADGLTNWSSSGGTWNVTSDAYSGTSAITSTMSAPYANNDSKTLQLTNSLNFAGVENALIYYYTKWDLERSFDYVQLEASTNSISWTPLCGKYTKSGASDENNTYSGKSSSENDFQPDGEPLYDGDSQDKWRREEIIISNTSNAFLLDQSDVYIRFSFMTDASNAQSAYYNANFEGFTFDDFNCIQLNENTLGEDELNIGRVLVYPNPAKDVVTLEIANASEVSQLSIVSLNGQEVYHSPIQNGKLEVACENWYEGIYFLMIHGVHVEKFVKQ